MTSRFCICIPTYNNPATIEAVVEDCLKNTAHPILIVDDGSEPPVKTEWPDSRVSVLRLPHNLGKGAALQIAFAEAVSRGYTHLISMDGDGQHLASEIAKLEAISASYPWDLAIGARKLASENVPGISKFGRGFSNFWVHFQTSQRISDSQSGFRIYPLFQMQNIRFWTKRFDFEIEVLIRLIWKGVGVRETEIECYYPAPDERVSHFDKIWDNVRISFLNTVLVVLSLLRAHQSPGELGLAIGIGIWIGCTPFFGLHSVMAAAVAVAFRLNAVYLVLGSQISIAPFAPILVFLSLRLGKILTGARSGSAMGFSRNWLVGSFVLGLILAVIGGAAAYLVARSAQKRESSGGKATWNGRTRGGSVGNSILKKITQLFGLRTAYALLYFIVPYFYFFAPRARRSSNEYWKQARPELGWGRRQLKVLKHFYRFAQTLLDRVYQGFHSEPVFDIRSHGTENITPGRGLLLLSAHVGAWDLAAARLTASDRLAGEFHSVQYESQGRTFDKVRNQRDPERLKKLVANRAEQPVLQIREILGRGLPVALMGDRPVGNHFELVKIFGKLCPIDCTAFRISAACETPLLFTFGFKGEGKGYDFFATPARVYSYPPGGDRAKATLGWAQDYAATIEGMLKKYPYQWFNFFPFWSEAPRPPGDAEATPAPQRSREASESPHSLEVGAEPVSTPIA